MGSTKACVLAVCAGLCLVALRFMPYPFFVLFCISREDDSSRWVILVGGVLQVSTSASFCLGSANGRYQQFWKVGGRRRLGYFSPSLPQVVSLLDASFSARLCFPIGVLGLGFWWPHGFLPVFHRPWGDSGFRLCLAIPDYV